MQMFDEGVAEDQGGIGFAEVQFDSPTLGDLALRYRINSIPTLLSFSRGEPQIETRLNTLEQMKEKAQLWAWITDEAKRGDTGGKGGRSFLGTLFG